MRFEVLKNNMILIGHIEFDPTQEHSSYLYFHPVNDGVFLRSDELRDIADYVFNINSAHAEFNAAVNKALAA
jgi:hypothetical protein